MTPASGNLGDLNRAHDPDRIAMIDAGPWDAPITLSHGEVEGRANAVARGLLARGHAAGERIAILAANSADYLIAYFATMRAGMISVPVNWRFPPETISYVLRDAGVSFAFVDAAQVATLPAGLPHAVIGPGLEDFGTPGTLDVFRPTDDDVAMILYTSGSTGVPKGVPLTHRGHMWAAETRIRANPASAEHRFLVAAPLYHMNALAISKVAQLAGGSQVILPRFTEERYLEAIERFRCTWLTSVPPMMARVVRSDEILARVDRSSVTIVAMGSAPATQGLFDSIRETFPGARIVYGYGTTEAGPANFGAHPDGLPTPDLALGHPLSEARIRLADGDDLNAEQGVLQVDCPALMPGYHNLPQKTAEAMTADGYYVTGDIMRRDENGFHYFVGRADDMFVSNGENVYPVEVERLLESHPDVAQACVVPVADEIRGTRPIAFVVRAAGAGIEAQGVKDHALAGGPAYQHPREVHFLDEMPLASTNKIDRALLTEQAEALAAAG